MFLKIAYYVTCVNEVHMRTCLYITVQFYNIGNWDSKKS